MRLRTLLPAALAALLAAGCDSVLDVEPTTDVPADRAIVDPETARAALAGAYDALQDDAYYGESFVTFSDLSADNARHSGTFTNYGDADANDLRSDNGTIELIWEAIYTGIDRVNVVLARTPEIEDLDEAERDQMLGEAHLLRALHYHNLVKLWGPVPIRLTPIEDVGGAADITRAPVTEVYTQILNDLQQAATLISDSTQTRRASAGAVRALEARVRLYNQDWAGALAAADAVLAMDYQLARDYDDLFTAQGNDTPEDILRVSFAAEDPNYLGYYYFSRSFGGRREVAPTSDLINAFDDADLRGRWSIAYDDQERAYGSKFPTTIGAEHVHVIRLAEVVLTRAEALARLNRLGDAVAAYNQVRARAGLAPHVLGDDVSTQQDVLEAIWTERRLELAFEGDRWPDLIRTNRAVEVLEIPEFQALYPIPQREIDVAPGLAPNNPGY